jgi:hypothetical protein
MKRITTWIAEQWSNFGTSLRSSYRALYGSLFWPTRSPYDRTRISYELTRQLYRNDGKDSRLGAAFCKPIVDRTVEFMGTPQIASDDEDRDNELNNAIQKQWKPALLEVFRNSLRDSCCVVRMYRPSVRNPLVTEEEREACAIEVYAPEQVTIEYDPQDGATMFPRIQRAIIVSWVPFPDRDTQPRPDPQRGARVQVKEHEIWEILTPDKTTYWDRTDNKYLTEWERDNPDGFVPLIEVYNEWDSTIHGGQSEYETVYPFIKAFHEVFLQGLKAHKYHSLPKIKFKVKDVDAFLANNYPETIDPVTKRPKPQSVVRWEGREMLFLSPEEDIEAIEVTSVLGDTKTLLEFLVDCIAVAAEMPEEMFMRTEAGATSGTGDKKFLAFERKIERKRTMYQPFIIMLCKMRQVMNSRVPEVGEVLWEEVTVDNLVKLTSAFEKLVMSLEVVLQRQLVSDDTARSTIRSFRLFRRMKSPQREAEDAKDNFEIEPPAADVPGDGSNGAGSRERVPTPVRTSRAGGKNE